MVFIELTEDYVLRFGIEVAGSVPTSPNTDRSRFKLIYGIHCQSAKDVFDKLQQIEGEFKIDQINLFHYFITLYWIHNCLKEILMCRMFKVWAEKALRKYNWMYFKAIGSLASVEVRNIYIIIKHDLSLTQCSKSVSSTWQHQKGLRNNPLRHRWRNPL